MILTAGPQLLHACEIRRQVVHLLVRQRLQSIGMRLKRIGDLYVQSPSGSWRHLPRPLKKASPAAGSPTNTAAMSAGRGADAFLRGRQHEHRNITELRIGEIDGRHLSGTGRSYRAVREAFILFPSPPPGWVRGTQHLEENIIVRQDVLRSERIRN
jgi:hypothetical protein